jgi:hypothetical protein
MWLHKKLSNIEKVSPPSLIHVPYITSKQRISGMLIDGVVWYGGHQDQN